MSFLYGWTLVLKTVGLHILSSFSGCFSLGLDLSLVLDGVESLLVGFDVCINWYHKIS